MINRSRLWQMLIATLLFSMTIYWMGPLCQQIVGHLWLKQGVTQTIGGSQTPTTFQGLLLQKKAMESPDIFPIYGSSEFSATSEFHPSHVFEGKPTGFVPFLVGRGGTQDIIHALNMAALGDSLKDKKIAIILSPQWFSPEGISQVYFNQNFSPLHAYRMLYDSSLTATTKKQLIKRILAFPGAFADDPTLYALLNLDINKGRLSNFQSVILEVKGRIEMAALEVKDAGKSVQFIQKLNPESIARNATSTASALPSWLKLKDKAMTQGQAATQNNQFGILDDYYLQYVQPKLAENRGSATNSTFYPSPEYQDLGLLLQILQEEKAKPLFVIVPVNGSWYDYIGFPARERQAFYEQTEKMIRDKSFEVANFGDHEYDSYFLQDVMHLGWKGWANVDEALDQFYHEGT